MAGENYVGITAGAVVLWVNSLDYVFLGNITQLIALVYLLGGIILKFETRFTGKRLISKAEYKEFIKWKKEREDDAQGGE